MVGISRATFFRWIKDGTIKDVLNKDRRGWRLFTEEDIEYGKCSLFFSHLSLEG